MSELEGAPPAKGGPRLFKSGGKGSNELRRKLIQALKILAATFDLTIAEQRLSLLDTEAPDDE